MPYHSSQMSPNTIGISSRQCTLAALWIGRETLQDNCNHPGKTCPVPNPVSAREDGKEAAEPRHGVWRGRRENTDKERKVSVATTFSVE